MNRAGVYRRVICSGRLAVLGLLLSGAAGCTPELQQALGEGVSSFLSSQADELIVFAVDFLRGSLAAFLL